MCLKVQPSYIVSGEHVHVRASLLHVSTRRHNTCSLTHPDTNLTTTHQHHPPLRSLQKL
ncbi:uncharacterized protein CC84DRAFT_1164562 [Paraphaeosphaeria sporulosa]|uniref:Uncharacterized protein n=1 Tax=Paraphaeosphaeria sporulosa TaxID=1460663 RepID=A0A177CF62_9PLEO|nr:uncharacterized protein CC84DRAFT_1164562 [Paraphaeosphaeria sporulosa]OAG06253.1 hypothetical protein CC84DRAFT_1164562 [Paraphaeosphaeria sporulosa]